MQLVTSNPKSHKSQGYHFPSFYINEKIAPNFVYSWYEFMYILFLEILKTTKDVWSVKS